MKYHVVFALFSVLSPFCAARGDIFQIVEMQDVQALARVTNDTRQVNSVNRSGDTPLMVAARRGHVVMVKMLLDSGADVNACNKGFPVKEQIESYLRRTGESGKRIVALLKRLDLDKEMIQGFQKTSESLGGTPERIAAWKTILELVSARGPDPSRLSSFPDEMKRLTLADWQRRTDSAKLKMDDLRGAFPFLEATTNELRLALRDDGSRYSAVFFDRRKSCGILGGERFSVSAGGALGLTGDNLRVTIESLASAEADASVLWRFDVELKFTDIPTTKEGVRFRIRRGVLCARRKGPDGIVMEVE